MPRKKKEPISTEEELGGIIPESAEVAQSSDVSDLDNDETHEFVKKELPKRKKRTTTKKTPAKKRTSKKKEEQVVEEAPLAVDESKETSMAEDASVVLPPVVSVPPVHTEAEETSLDPIAQEKIRAQLTEIYENKDGSMPDMSHFEGRPRNRFFRVFFGMLATAGLLAGAAYGAFMYFDIGKGFSEKDVVLTVSGVEEIEIGQQVEYTVAYNNTQTVPLARTVLEVRYPEGFVFESASVTPENESNTRWSIGSLDAEESGSITIVGRLYGDVNSERSLRSFLNYTPANFSSEFQKVSTFSTTLAKSPVELALKGPSELGVNTTGEFEFTLEKTTEDPLNFDEVLLEIVADNTFVKQESDKPSTDLQQMMWSADTLTAPYTLKLKGSFMESADGAERTLVARAIGVKKGTGQQERFVIKEESHVVALLKSDVQMDLVVNGGRGALAVRPGETLNTTVSVKNTGEEVLKDVRIRLVYDAPSVSNRSILDWANVQEKFDGAVVGEQIGPTVRRGSITWDAALIPALAELTPGEEIAIDVSLPIKNGEQTDLTAYTEHGIKIVSDLQYTGSATPKTATGAPVLLTLNSDLRLEITDEKTTDENERETRTITWLLKNSAHELKDVELTADIYGDITWLDSAAIVPAGTILFDPDKKRVTWKVETMPTSVDVLALQFPFVVNSKNPSQKTLVSRVTVKALDTVTNQTITIVGDEVAP